MPGPLTMRFITLAKLDNLEMKVAGVRLRLTANVGLVDRQIIVALPKLSAAHIEGLLAELTAENPTIARTVLNVTLDAAVPRAAARRYMAEYCRVAEQLEAIDPGVARTLANATSMARVPSEPI